MKPDQPLPSGNERPGADQQSTSAAAHARDHSALHAASHHDQQAARSPAEAGQNPEGHSGSAATGRCAEGEPSSSLPGSTAQPSLQATGAEPGGGPGGQPAHSQPRTGQSYGAATAGSAQASDAMAPLPSRPPHQQQGGMVCDSGPSSHPLADLAPAAHPSRAHPGSSRPAAGQQGGQRAQQGARQGGWQLQGQQPEQQLARTPQRGKGLGAAIGAALDTALDAASKFGGPFLLEFGALVLSTLLFRAVMGWIDGKAHEKRIRQAELDRRKAEVKLEDVGGLDKIVQELKDNILDPLKHSHLFKSSLAGIERGVLLYGPPGTGKTMLAKALAAECGMSFFVITPSTLKAPFYGETEQLVHAVWTVARQRQPAVIFIDEVDALLGQRGDLHENDTSRALKTEIMQLWDGIQTRRGENIVVMGATNRRDDLDPAVLRRFTLQFKVDLPKAEQRAQILACTLRRFEREEGKGTVDPALLELSNEGEGGSGHSSSVPSRASPLRDLAARTDGYSGSDLRQLCVRAVRLRIREILRSQEDAQEGSKSEAGSQEQQGSSSNSKAGAAKAEGSSERAEGHAASGSGNGMVAVAVASAEGSSGKAKERSKTSKGKGKKQKEQKEEAKGPPKAGERPMLCLQHLEAALKEYTPSTRKDGPPPGWFT